MTFSQSPYEQYDVGFGVVNDGQPGAIPPEVPIDAACGTAGGGGGRGFGGGEVWIAGRELVASVFTVRGVACLELIEEGHFPSAALVFGPVVPAPSVLGDLTIPFCVCHFTSALRVTGPKYPLV